MSGNPEPMRKGYVPCPKCGTAMKRESRTCKGCRQYHGEHSPRWKGESASPITGRWRATQLYPELGTCEHSGCLQPAVDRHHIDGITTNNERTNVAFLCRLHHLEEDGRLQAMRTDWCHRPRRKAA